MMKPIEVKVSDVPTNVNFDVKESAYFKSWNQLPSPAEVRARAAQYPGVKISTEPNWDPPAVLFREKRLWVKWGERVKLSDAQSLYVINKFLGKTYPAPEIYGWRVDNQEVFIYTEWMEGRTLEVAWLAMKAEDKTNLARELRQAHEALGQLVQDPKEKFVGTPARGTLYDRFFSTLTDHAGPFPSVKDFHEWFARCYRIRLPGGAADVPIEPYRYQLPDNAAIKFTHSDLHPSNIMVTASEPHKLLGIVDFEQSGWLPEYWEDLKARYSVEPKADWSSVYLTTILPRTAPAVVEAWDFYGMCIGP